MVFDSPQAVSRCYEELGRSGRDTLPPWVVDQLRKVVRRLQGSLIGSPLGRSPYTPNADELLVVDRALLRLETLDRNLAEVLKHQVFLGLSAKDTASALGVSEKVLERDWHRAKLWFYRYLQQEVVSSIGKPC